MNGINTTNAPAIAPSRNKPHGAIAECMDRVGRHNQQLEELICSQRDHIVRITGNNPCVSDPESESVRAEGQISDFHYRLSTTEGLLKQLSQLTDALSSI